MKTVSIIRDRGQLTIPDSVRRIVSWIYPMSPVSILVVQPDEIVIKPHEKEVNWDKIWAGIQLSRSFKGKTSKPLSEFIAEDRYNH